MSIRTEILLGLLTVGIVAGSAVYTLSDGSRFAGEIAAVRTDASRTLQTLASTIEEGPIVLIRYLAAQVDLLQQKLATFIAAHSGQRSNTEIEQNVRMQLPARSVGVSKHDLAMQYLGIASGGDGSEAYRDVTVAMAQKAIADAHDAGMKFIRIGLQTGYNPLYYGSKANDLALWQTNPALYWQRMDQMMADLRAKGMGAVPVFGANEPKWAALSGPTETTRNTITDPTSASYQLLTKYIGEYIAHYKDHPALYFYELTNEMNNAADLDQKKHCLKSDTANKLPCAHLDRYTTDEAIAFAERLANFIRARDSKHLISPGYTTPRINAEHLRACPEWSACGPDRTPDSLLEFKKHLTDTHKGMDLVSVHFYNKPDRGTIDNFGVKGKYNAGVLDSIKQTADEMGKPLYVGEFGDNDPHIDEPSNTEGRFAQAVLQKIVDLGIPYASPFVWEFYQKETYTTYVEGQGSELNIEPGYTDVLIAKIAETNKILGSIPAPDLLEKPRVVLTWPLEGTTVKGMQLLYAVASTGQGKGVSHIDFLVDGAVIGRSATPPYQMSWNSLLAADGAHVISVIGRDAAGNATTKSARVIVQNGIR